MAEQIADKVESIQPVTVQLPCNFPGGEVVDVDVSDTDYMDEYATTFHEWVEGVVIKMSPVSTKHDGLTRFLDRLLSAYLETTNTGQLRAAPFVMRLEKSRREPDLQVILEDNPGQLTDTYMDGPADICLEIVSPSNAGTDYGDKFLEYEQAGVREYWIIDPMRIVCRFNRLSEAGHYEQIMLNSDVYTTPLLPGFELRPSILWEEELPNLFEVAQMVQDMLKED